MYDLNKDPHQLDNIAKTVKPQKLLDYNKRLIQLMVCAGLECHSDSKLNYRSLD